VIKGKIEHKKLIVDILVSAFIDLEEDNSINYIVGNGKDRTARMEALMGYLFEKSLLFGEIHISTNKTSCLLVAFSEKEKVTLKTILLDIELAFKCIKLKNVFKILKRQKAVKQFYPKNQGYIKPVIMGSLKDAYGSGSAARMVLQVMKGYTDNKKPVIVDTVSDYNIKLYKKFGFRVINKEESLGFPMTLLRIN